MSIYPDYTAWETRILWPGLPDTLPNSVKLNPLLVRLFWKRRSELFVLKLCVSLVKVSGNPSGAGDISALSGKMNFSTGGKKRVSV